MTQLSDWIVAGGNPTAVDLTRFEAWAANGAIHIEWETANDADTLGFNLYRSCTAGGEYEWLNETLIPGMAPGAGAGADYT